jgi:hypothetical protein
MAMNTISSASIVSHTEFPRPIVVQVRDIIAWAVFVSLLAALAIYLVGVEQGATSIVPGMYIHEFLHDGRHSLGFPCH